MKHSLSAAALASVLGVHAFGQIATTTSLVGAVTTITAVNTGTQNTYNTTTDQGY